MSDYLDKPIIFIGFPRSGTTIISETTFQHHKLGWVSNYQAKFPNSSSINLLRNLFHNALWNINGQKNQLNKVPLFNKYIFKPGEAYSFWNHITGRDFGKSFLFNKKENDRKKQQIRSFCAKIVKYQKRERLAFKVTGPSRLVYLHSIFPDACFIRIKRKPLPTLRSLLRVGFWNKRGGKNKLWWDQKGIYDENERRFVQEVKEDEPALLAALQYYKVDEIHEKEIDSCDARVCKVRYEDFTDHSDDVIQKILSFTELEYDHGINNYLEQNEIYNRNESEDYFIGSEIDKQVKDVAKRGIKNFSTDSMI